MCSERKGNDVVKRAENNAGGGIAAVIESKTKVDDGMDREIEQRQG